MLLLTFIYKITIASINMSDQLLGFLHHLRTASPKRFNLLMAVMTVDIFVMDVPSSLASIKVAL